LVGRIFAGPTDQSLKIRAPRLLQLRCVLIYWPNSGMSWEPWILLTGFW